MKPRTGSIMDLRFVKFFPQRCHLFTAPRIGPAENFCRWLAFCIDADQTVPKRTRRNVADLTLDLFRFPQNLIDCRNDLIERFVGIDLRTAVIGRGQRALILNHRSRQHIAIVVIQRGAHARRADVQCKDEIFVQSNESQ